MHARIATFELDSPEATDQMMESVRQDVEQGSPLEDSKGVLVLVDRDKAKAMAVVLFGSEDGMKRGDEALNKMNPTDSGRRTSVEFYEVAVQRMM